jgi:hypothetical protein
MPMYGIKHYDHASVERIREASEKRGQAKIMLELGRMIDQKLNDLAGKEGKCIFDFNINDFYEIERDLINKFDLQP